MQDLRVLLKSLTGPLSVPREGDLGGGWIVHEWCHEKLEKRDKNSCHESRHVEHSSVTLNHDFSLVVVSSSLAVGR